MANQNGSHILPDRYRGLVIPVGLLVIWEVAARLGWINPVLLTSPTAIVHAGIIAIDDGELWPNLQASLVRMLLGWLTGAVIGLVLGAMIGLSRLGERLFGPTFNAFRQVAPFAWIPLISVWFGLGESSKIAFIAIVALYPVVVNTYEGIRSVPKEFVEVARVFDFSLWQLLRRVVIPAATPAILSGLELAFLYAWLATIGAEYLLNANGGIGVLIESAQERLAMDIVFLGVIISGLVGFGISVVTQAARSRLLGWRKSYDGA